MDYKEIYTYADTSSRHILGTTEHMPENMIKYCIIDIYGVPKDMNDNETEAALCDRNLAVNLGKITGYLVLGQEMFNREEDLYKLCDEVDSDLEYVMSALLEGDDVHNPDCLDVFCDHFYIHEIELTDETLFGYIIQNLTAIIFTHYQVIPTLLSYYPKPLQYKKSKFDKIKRDMALTAYAEAIKILMEGTTDENKPQIVLSDKQINILLESRIENEKYPQKYIDHAVWDKYINAGFKEWLNTRVLYKT